jgi:hypothetical protein
VEEIKFGSVECYQGEGGDGACVSVLTINAGEACSGSVAGVETGCFFIQDHAIYDGAGLHPALGGFYCESAADPCTLSPEVIYCSRPLSGSYFTPPQYTSGADPEEACELAAAPVGANQPLDLYELLTPAELAANISSAVESTCEGFDVSVAAECSLPGATFNAQDPAGQDTGLAALEQSELIANYDPDMVFWIDPATSKIRIRGANGAWSEAPLVGELLATQTPARFLLGAAFGGQMTVEGALWRNTWATFNTAIDVNPGSGVFTIPASESDAIVWAGTPPSGVRQAFAIAPANAASGTFSVANGTWTLNYAQNLPGGRRAVLSLGGFLQSVP